MNRKVPPGVDCSVQATTDRSMRALQKWHKHEKHQIAFPFRKKVRAEIPFSANTNISFDVRTSEKRT
jgi:hypothetical protein